MDIPNLTLQDARIMSDGAYKVAEDSNADPDYVMLNNAHRCGVNEAREEILNAIETCRGYSYGSWNEALSEIEGYLMSKLSFREWQDQRQIREAVI